MKTQSASYALRLPRSIKAAVERISREEGTSINQFVASAVAEKIAAMNAVEFFEARRRRADLPGFDAILRRKGGEAPRPGDEAV